MSIPTTEDLVKVIPITTVPMAARDAELIIVALQPTIITVAQLQTMFDQATVGVRRQKPPKTQSAIVQEAIPDGTVAVPVSPIHFPPYPHFH